MLAAWTLASCVAAATAPSVGLPGVELVGLVVAADPQRSCAVLRSPDRTRVVTPGENAFGARVEAIAPGRVTLEAAGRSVVLYLSASSAAAASVAVDAPGDQAPTGGGPVFTRSELERRIADETPRILAETALIPVSENGRVMGFTLSRLPEGSLLTDAGLRPGDVLVEINGTPVDSVGTLLALYPRLREVNEIRATVLRGGSYVPLVLQLR